MLGREEINGNTGGLHKIHRTLKIRNVLKGFYGVILRDYERGMHKHAVASAMLQFSKPHG